MAMGDHQILKTSFSLADVDSDIELINSLNFHQNYEDYIYSSSSSSAFNTSILPQYLLGGHGSFENNGVSSSSQPLINGGDDHKQKKRKAMEEEEDTPPQSTCSYSSPQISHSSGTATQKKINRGGRGKKKGEEEKPREVIHVRARRGQATDSHSLAERVRRGKINERLRCLQDIVPGCYKTMGMAVMLDEIINYVQSLQNQVEFLSMKLTAASTFHDFNAADNIDTMEEMQRANAILELAMKSEINMSNPTYAQNLGYSCPQLPHSNRS